jgi:hypothetical protein
MHVHKLLHHARAIKNFGLCTPLYNEKLTEEGLTLLDCMLLYIKDDWTKENNKNLLEPLTKKLIKAAKTIKDIDTIKHIAVCDMVAIIDKHIIIMQNTAAPPPHHWDDEELIKFEIIELYHYSIYNMHQRHDDFL